MTKGTTLLETPIFKYTFLLSDELESGVGIITRYLTYWLYFEVY